MRKEYNTPEMEVIVFEYREVITTSGDGWAYPEQDLGDGSYTPGEDEW